MRAVTDKNISSGASDIRRKAFDEATNLQSMKETELKIIIEGILFERISKRCEDDHLKALEDAYVIDYSVRGVEDYDIVKGINWIVDKKYSRLGKVLIITESSNFSRFKTDKLNVFNITPFDFIEKVNLFKKNLEMNKKILKVDSLTSLFINRLIEVVLCDGLE